jgi:hypothetical protein
MRARAGILERHRDEIPDTGPQDAFLVEAEPRAARLELHPVPVTFGLQPKSHFCKMANRRSAVTLIPLGAGIYQARLAHWRPR